MLGRENIRTTFKPVKTLGSIFKKPKDRPATNQIKGIVYKDKCKTCDFAYVGESKRSWNSRDAEHKPNTRSNNESAIRFHAETTALDIHPDHVDILVRNVNNRQQRLFLEVLHSIHSSADNQNWIYDFLCSDWLIHRPKHCSDREGTKLQ